MTDAVRDSYDENAELYASLFLRDLDRDTNATSWLSTFAELTRQHAGPVADLGCGPGHVTNHLSGLGLTAVGYDISPGQIAQARHAFPDLCFEVGDLAALGIVDGSLGGIVSRYSIIHFVPSLLAKVFGEWRRVLDPGAPVLVSFFGATSAEAHGTPFDHKVATAYALHPATIAEELRSAGFVDIEVGVQPPPEGGRPFDQGTVLARRPVSDPGMEGVTYIDDPADPRVDDYRELNSIAVRAEMERDEFFMGEGYVPIDRMLDSGHRMRSVLLHPKRVKRFVPTMDRPEMAGVPVYVAEQDVMAEIVGFNMYRTCLASAFRAPMPTVADLARSCRRIVVLEALNDDQNVGAIARAARAFEIDGIVISPTCNDPYQRRTVRVSMGEILHMPVARAAADDWPNALDTLHDHGFHTWAMTPAADAVDLWDAVVPEKVAVVLGAEGHGLEEATMRATTHRVRIPISPVVDSLNVGHAAAVTFAAVARPPRP